jgi:hypothetical protein
LSEGVRVDRRENAGAVVAALAIAVLLAIAAHGAWYAAGFYGIGWDEAGRSIDAYFWHHDSVALRATTWLPFHRMVIGSALAIHPDLFITPRVVTSLFGLGTLAMLTWLAAELFRDPRVACTTAILGALFTPRVVLALAPLSCTMFSCVILGAMAALARWLGGAPRAWLFAAALGFALSTTIRYEGWAFAMAFGVAVFAGCWTGRQRTRIADAAAVGIIVSAFPVLWLGLHAVQNGNPFAFLSDASTGYADWWTVWRKNPLTEFVIVNGATVNLVGIAAVVTRARAEARFRTFLFVATAPLVLIATSLFASKHAQSGPSWRMIVVWSLLLLPFTADVITGLRQRLPRVGAAAVIALSVLYVGSTYWMWRHSRWAVPENERALGSELNRLVTTRPVGMHVLIDTSKFSYLNVLVSSQRPEVFILNSIPERADDPAAVIAADRSPSTPDLRARGIGLLVFRSPELRAVLTRDAALQQVGNFGDWAVYELR